MMLSLFFILIAAINSTIGNFFLKVSREAAPIFTAWYGRYLSIYFILAVFFYMLNLVFFSKALDKIPVAVAYPILAGLGFSLLSIAAHYVFKEELSLMQWAGLLVTAVGIFLLAK